MSEQPVSTDESAPSAHLAPAPQQQPPRKPLMLTALLCGGGLLVGGFVGAGIASANSSESSIHPTCASAFTHGENVRTELSNALTGSGEALRAYALGESGALDKMRAQTEASTAAAQRIRSENASYSLAKAECLAGDK